MGSEGLVTISDLVSKETIELKYNEQGKVEKLELAFSIKINKEHFLLTSNTHGRIDIWSCEPKFKVLRTYSVHSGLCVFSELYSTSKSSGNVNKNLFVIVSYLSRFEKSLKIHY